MVVLQATRRSKSNKKRIQAKGIECVLYTPEYVVWEGETIGPFAVLVQTCISSVYPIGLLQNTAGCYFYYMSYFFQHWVDLTAMALSLIAAISMAVKLVRNHPIRPVAAFFFVFGPLVIGVHMFFHVFNNAYIVAERIRAHAFQYDFRMYSRFLMGLVLGYLSIRLLRQCLYKCAVLHSSNRPMYKTMLATAVVSLPTVVFTPIGSLPAMGCVVSLLALAFLKRKMPASEMRLVPISDASQRDCMRF